MSRDSSFDYIDSESFLWNYPLSTSNYEQTRRRGRGIADINYKNQLCLAAQVIGIQEKVMPLGYMPTTQKMLEEKNLNEITPLLRQLGINGQHDEINLRSTKKVVVEEVDIRIDDNVPIILNSELFAMTDDEKIEMNSDKDNWEEGDPYDPNRPLHEQFSTIREFWVPTESIEKESIKSIRANIDMDSSGSSRSKSTSSKTFSTSLSSVCDESSISTRNTIKTNESEQDSYDEIFQPLIETGEKVYTPRQLYNLKKKQCVFKTKYCSINLTAFQ